MQNKFNGRILKKDPPAVAWLDWIELDYLPADAAKTFGTLR